MSRTTVTPTSTSVQQTENGLESVQHFAEDISFGAEDLDLLEEFFIPDPIFHHNEEANYSISTISFSPDGNNIHGISALSELFPDLENLEAHIPDQLKLDLSVLSSTKAAVDTTKVSLAQAGDSIYAGECVNAALKSIIKTCQIRRNKMT